MTRDTDTEGTGLRRLILDTTRHLLVRDGYGSLSMRKIARAIDYSATSIYLHFESKDALFEALIEEGMQHLYRHLQDAEDRHPDDPIARLRALSRCYIQYGLDNPEYYEIMFILHPERDSRFPAEKYRRARRNLDLLAAALEEGAAQKQLHVDDPRVAASALWATLHGAVALLMARRIDVQIDRDEFIQTVVGQAVDGLAASAEVQAAS